MNDDRPPDGDGRPQGVSVQGQLSTDNFGAGDHRSAERIAVAMDAGLRKSGGSTVATSLLDLSTHGFRAETHLNLDPGDTIWVRLPGLESMPAIVKWARGSRIGAAFERPLLAAVLETIIARSGN